MALAKVVRFNISSEIGDCGKLLGTKVRWEKDSYFLIWAIFLYHLHGWDQVGICRYYKDNIVLISISTPECVEADVNIGMLLLMSFIKFPTFRANTILNLEFAFNYTNAFGFRCAYVGFVALCSSFQPVSNRGKIINAGQSLLFFQKGIGKRLIVQPQVFSMRFA